MSHSVKRSKSKFEQARMVVPEDIRHLVGQREWTKSLKTTDPEVARRKRAEWIALWSAEVTRCREANVRRPVAEGLQHLETAFTRLAARRGSLDAAIEEQLALLASFTCDSWVGSQDNDDVQWWGEFLVRKPVPELEPVPSWDTKDQRHDFQLRVQILEGRGIADGMIHQELANVLLERRTFRPIWSVVSYMCSIERRIDLERDDVYEAVAEACLTRLAQHRFENWTPRVREALMPFAPAARPAPVPSPVLAGIPASTSVRMPSHRLWDMPLKEALNYWKEKRRLGASAVREATRAVSRFEAAFGALQTGAITREMIIEFRDLIADMPPQLELTRLAKTGRGFRNAIEDARDQRRKWEEGDRRTPKLDKLAPASVKKDVGGLSAILGKIVNDTGTGINVAAKVEIAGYSKTRTGQKVQRHPFTPTIMQNLFDSPMFTGCAGLGDAARVRPGQYVYQDEMYWSFLFGVVGGPRLGEIGQIALADVHECK